MSSLLSPQGAQAAVSAMAPAQIPRDPALGPSPLVRLLTAQQFVVPGRWNGLVQRGNIDLNARPVVHNSDGSISTVRSASFGIGPGREVLVPTVVNGKVVSLSAALANFQKTGQHLGIFRSPADADAYAEALHQEQAKAYGHA